MLDRQSRHNKLCRLIAKGERKLRYLSLCSGIEAASCAWESLGWEPVGFSEIEPFPCAVLAYHYPGVKNYGDMTKYKEWDNVRQFDVLVGGTPCQSFSVAGLRRGLEDPRGNLMLTYGAIANHFKPSWLLWENVPGVLSSNGGRDFGTFLGMLGELGYGFAYRVLDAQYYGVAQRRRRVFLVGYLGDWRRAAAVLFESEGLLGNPPPSRESGKGTSRGIEIGPGGGSFTDVNPTLDTRCKDGPIRNQLAGAVMVASGTQFGEEVAGTLTRRHDSSPCADRGQNVIYDMRGRGDGNTSPTLCTDHASRPSDFCPIVMATGQGNAEITEGHAPTLNCNHEAPILSYGIPGNWIGREPKNGGNAVEPMHDIAPCLTKTDQHGVSKGTTVRRLTPRECERFQGFPDNWTQIPWRGSAATDCPDGPRYKAIGNSMAVPVMRWIGERVKSLTTGST